MAEPNGTRMSQGKPQYQFNGINSNNSSREASPVPRVGYVPSSQLPPGRGSLPASQFPPSRATVPVITQKVAQLGISGQNTPNISPSKFSASTPNPGVPEKAIFSEQPSPVVPNSLENVPLSDTGSSNINRRLIGLPATLASSAHSNTISSQNVSSQASQYFNQTSSFDEFINAPGHQAQNIQPLQSRQSPFLQASTPSSQVPLNVSSVKQTSASNLFPQPSTSVPFASNIQAPSVYANQPHSAGSLGQFSQNSVPPPAQSTGLYSSASQQSVFTNKPPNAQVSSTYSTFSHSQTIPNYQPQQNIGNVPPTQSSLARKPRYPQTLPSNPSPSLNVNQGLPPAPSQFSGLNQGVPSVPQAGAGQVYATPQATGPHPSQRFNPQINYNAQPVTSLNGPSAVPANAQMQGRQTIASNRYPTSSAGPQQQRNMGLPSQQAPYQTQGGGVVQTGFSRLWGGENYDLLQIPNILPPTKTQLPPINLGQEQLNQANCSTEVFRSTVTKIPESASLLQKSRLPLGLLIHPFKDLSYLPVIQCNVIVRCRSCRTYINPFVYFVDAKRWKCNLCFRVNELPEEFQYDPVSKTYGDPSRRPEIKSSTIEYIAPAEYMLRPPQPAVYLFLLDVSRLAVESGYLDVLCLTLLEELKNLPGDARTQIGFLAYDSALHFFSLAEGLNQPHEMTILDIEDVFLPTPDNLLVNLKDRMELIEDLLKLLPNRFANSFDGNSALGAALQVAHKLMGPTGGRVTVFQAALPNVGPGAVTSREDPNQRATAETLLLNPANDFYKRLALDCSGQQIAVDLFVVNSQYVDMATISGISRFSGGSVHHFPLFKLNRPLVVDMFQKNIRRYLTRKIGFEAVMRVRCTRGLAIHTFHGNLFVRSTDLLSLPNINPDAAFGMQVGIEENLADSQNVCFQAALLYTSSKGERRIRVHTLCLPIANTLHDVIQSADQQCIVGLLGKMAVDRSTQASLLDAREAFINAAVDVLTAYKFSLNLGTSTSGLLVPECLKLLPLYISAILKHPAFRIGVATRLDDRIKAMIDMKSKPLQLLMQQIYPDLYPVHNLELQEVVLNGEEESVPLPPRLQLSARCLENKGAFLMDCGDQMMILVGPNVSKEFLNEALGVPDYSGIDENMIEVPILNNLANQRLLQFINHLNDEKPYNVSLQILRDNSPNRGTFLEKLIEDRLENSLSYHEFLQHLKAQVK